MANDTVESTTQQTPSGIQINPNAGPMKVDDGEITKKWSIEEVRHHATLPFVNASQGHSAGVYAPMV